MDVFEALADPVRRGIISLLAVAPATTVGEVGVRYPISRPAVSRHLRVLREAGLVSSTKRGRVHLLRLDPAALAPVRELLASVDGATPTAVAPEAAAGRLRIPDSQLDALDLEVRRTVRERSTSQAEPKEEAG